MEKTRSLTDRDFTDLWEQHSFWIILLIAAYAFDTLSTIHFMVQDGIHYELHPLVRHSAMILGPVTGTILSAFLFKSVVAIWLALYLKHIRMWVLIIPAILSTIAGFLNFS
ncbi:MAG: hypothetical protein ACYSOF_03980 [Planctomycetota bacterium]|jgi:hypothetical protein